MNPDLQTARRTPLASGDLCEVEHCVDCDVVHVHVGYASLRLTRSGFFALCATLLEAARRIETSASLERTGLQ